MCVGRILLCDSITCRRGLLLLLQQEQSVRGKQGRAMQSVNLSSASLVLLQLSGDHPACSSSCSQRCTATGKQSGAMQSVNLSSASLDRGSNCMQPRKQWNRRTGLMPWSRQVCDEGSSDYRRPNRCPVKGPIKCCPRYDATSFARTII